MSDSTTVRIELLNGVVIRLDGEPSAVVTTLEEAQRDQRLALFDTKTEKRWVNPNNVAQVSAKAIAKPK